MILRDFMRSSLIACGASLLVVAGLPHPSRAATGDETPSAAELQFFETEIRPLLIKECYECHSGQAKKLKAGLRLDSRAAILAGGDSGPALQPGDAASSLLMQAVRYEAFEMPPRGKLSDKQIALLARWIEMGVPWTQEQQLPPLAAAESREFDWQAKAEGHWCWQPIAVVEPPPDSQGWSEHPVDRFVAAKLQAAGLSPAERADKRTLVRRLYFDLIGLPPTASEVQAFVRDDRPEAYALLVDHLLASEHFGEKWARHWMDLVRYAETCGHEFDYPIPNAFRYRDYLIRAFNADVPYDQLIREHIAGDLLASPRLHPREEFNESIIGTGFWWLGEAVHSPTDVRGDEADRVNNQIDVMTRAFLGLTVACARCHDHKFDPIPTQDYYALAGYLQSSRRQEAMLDPHGAIAAGARQIREAQRRGSSILSSHAPTRDATDWQFLLQELAHSLPVSEGAGTDNRPERNVERGGETAEPPASGNVAWRNAAEDPELWQPTHPLYSWRRLVDYRDRPAEFAAERRRLAAELDELQQRAEREFAKTELFEDFAAGADFGPWFVTGEAFGSRPTQAGEWVASQAGAQRTCGRMADSGLASYRLQGVLRSPTFELKHTRIHYRTNARSAQIRLIVDGYTMDIYNALLFADVTLENVNTEGRFRWVKQQNDLYHYLGHRAHLEIIDHGDGFAAVDEIRFSNDAEPVDPPHELARDLVHDESLENFPLFVSRLASRLAEFDDQRWQVSNWLARHGLTDVAISKRQTEAEAGNAARLPDELADLQSRIRLLESQLADPIKVQALTDGSSEDEFIHVRGSHLNLGQVAPRRFLVAIAGEVQPPITHGSGRLELARAITSPDNPLTARVAVNRLWHHLFGRGLVPTVDDMGRMGMPPSHPELLDWLAEEFLHQGWSVKTMLRQLVMSQTYQMASTPRDPALTARIDPDNRWLSHAALRRLSAEQLRDSLLAVSGQLDETPFGPSVPVYLTPFMTGRGRPESGPLDGNRRRSIYVEIRRNFLAPMMLTFDMPSPFSCMGRRSASNVPAQSLMLLNDPFVHQQTQHWAERLLAAVPETPVVQSSPESDLDSDPDSDADSEARLPSAAACDREADGDLSCETARLQLAFETAFARPATAIELAACREFLRAQAAEHGCTAQELPPWQELCHALVNMKEFLFLR